MRNLFVTMTVAALFSCSSAEASRWAILIGPEQYGESGELRPLPYAGSDIQRMATTLINTGHPKDQVIVMTTSGDDTDLRPIRTSIYRQIREVVSRMGNAEAESLMVVFAGHGINIDGRSYLCPDDARLDAPDDTLIPLSQLSSLLANCNAAQKFLIIDACREEISAAGKTEFNLLTGLNSMKLQNEGTQGLVFFASCLARQRSIEDTEAGAGVFLFNFSEGINGLADVSCAGNRDGEVSCHEAFQFASEQTRKRSRELTGWEQQPWYEGRATSGLSLARLTKERREQLRTMDAGEADQLSGSVLHSQMVLSEALMSLKEGNIEAVLERSLEAIELDSRNRMAYRTAAMAYQFTGKIEDAIATMVKISEPLNVKVSVDEVGLKLGTEVVATAKRGDTMDAVSVQKDDNGKVWVYVTAIRRKDSEPIPVQGYVKIDELASQPVPAEQLVADFGARNQQPVHLTQSWQPGTGRAALAAQRYSSGIQRYNDAIQRYDEVRSVISSVPYAPSIPSVPSIPYVGGFFR